MKLCKDCRHCRPDYMLLGDKFVPHYRAALCGKTTNPVDGGPSRLCQSERDNVTGCGPEGRNWEANENHHPR